MSDETNVERRGVNQTDEPALRVRSTPFIVSSFGSFLASDSPPPAGFVHDDNDRKRSECKWRRDEPSQEAEGLGKVLRL